MLAALLYFFETMLTHARSVGIELLRRVVGRVEVQLAVLGQAEGGSAIRLDVASSVGVSEVEEEAALGGVDGRKVDFAGGAESQDLEGSGSLGSGVGSGSGSSKAAEDGESEKSLELHFEGFKVVVKGEVVVMCCCGLCCCVLML